MVFLTRLFLIFRLGGHKEFHSRHKDMCENSLLPAPLSASCPPDVDRESMDTHPLTKVLPFLYLGNSKDADDRDGMTAIGVTRVLNVTTSQQSPSPTMDHRASGVVYKRLSVLDNGHANLKQYFEEAFEFIGKSLFSVYHIIFCALYPKTIISGSYYYYYYGLNNDQRIDH